MSLQVGLQVKPTPPSLLLYGCYGPLKSSRLDGRWDGGERMEVVGDIAYL